MIDYQEWCTKNFYMMAKQGSKIWMGKCICVYEGNG